MLNKEKLKRSKARQKDYESKNDDSDRTIDDDSMIFLALFSMKKSMKEYGKRLAVLENTSFDSGKPVC